MPAAEGRLRFHARVAVNVPGHRRAGARRSDRPRRTAHAERLAGLGVADDAELAARIRAGDLRRPAGRGDGRRLGPPCADKLAVANPRYLDTP